MCVDAIERALNPLVCVDAIPVRHLILAVRDDPRALEHVVPRSPAAAHFVFAAARRVFHLAC